MNAIDLTRSGLIRALETAIAGRPAIDAAVRTRAESIAAQIAEEGTDARVVRRGRADYAVEARGEGLPAKAFGPPGAPPQPETGPLTEDPS